MKIDSNLDISSVLSMISSTESTDTESDFSDVLNQALDSVKETESANDQGNLELLAGEDVGIHETVIQAEKAELALELALQVRNKVIDAYNEIMRMQL